MCVNNLQYRPWHGRIERDRTVWFHDRSRSRIGPTRASVDNHLCIDDRMAVLEREKIEPRMGHRYGTSLRSDTAIEHKLYSENAEQFIPFNQGPSQNRNMREVS